MKKQIKMLWAALAVVLVVALVGWFRPTGVKHEPYMKAGTIYIDRTNPGKIFRALDDWEEKPAFGSYIATECLSPGDLCFRDVEMEYKNTGALKVIYKP